MGLNPMPKVKVNDGFCDGDIDITFLNQNQTQLNMRINSSRMFNMLHDIRDICLRVVDFHAGREEILSIIEKSELLR